MLEAREGELTFYEGPAPASKPKPAPAVRLELVLHATGGGRVRPPLPLGGNPEVRLQ